MSLPDSQSRTVGPGQLFMVSLNGWEAECTIEGPLEFGLLECSSEIWNSLVSESDYESHLNKACIGCDQRMKAIFLQNTIDPRMVRVVERLHDNRGSTASERLKVEAGTLDLLVFASEITLLSEAPAAEPCVRKSDREALLAAATYLEENLSADHSLAALSKQANINEFKLKRGFREYFKTTVFGYLRRKRMERARYLLSYRDTTVIEVANEVGYSNPSHFSRAFREAFGDNPKTYISKFQR